MTKRYKIVLFIRFLGYFIFFIGLISLIFLLGPVVKAESKYRIDKILGVKRTLPNIITSKEHTQDQSGQNSPEGSKITFESIKNVENAIIPISTEYGIVIEKINANAKIIPNVNPANEKEYVKALSEGVAEALGSTKPGEVGNLYLFSHSTDAPWNIIRYNAIFYLLKELEAGDRVVIFYQNRRYDYIVYDKKIVSPNDVSYLTNKYDVPVLTLQTCDPPGTLFNRLVVRAKLVSN